MNAASPRMAMFRKELREGRPLGLLMLLNSIGVLALVVRSIYPNSRFGASTTITDAASATALLAPAIGLLIGLVYAFPESRGDRWAFLTHRPIDRTGIFVATIGAAMVWYLVALTVPVASMLVWAATPGNVAAPFDLLMARPFVVDIISGAVWLLAGVACVMRRARWYGTRALPAVAAIVLSSLMTRPLTFGPALAFALGALLLNAALAWGSFVSGGHDEEQPVAGRAALVLNALAAYAGIAALLTAMVVIVNTYSASGRSVPSVRLTTDGALVRVVPRDDGRGHVFEDSRRRRRPDLDDSTARARALPPMSIASSTMELARSTTGVTRYRGYRQSADLVVAFPHAPVGMWSYVNRDGLFENYDNITRRRTGRLGPDGFVPDSTGALPTRRFQGPPLRRDDSMTLPLPFGLGAAMGSDHDLSNPLAFRDAVYRFNSRAYAVTPIFRAPAGETIVGISHGTHERIIRDDGSEHAGLRPRSSNRGQDSAAFVNRGVHGEHFTTVATNAFLYVLVNDSVRTRIPTAGMDRVRTKIPTAGMALDAKPIVVLVRHPDIPSHPTLVHVIANGMSRSMVFDSLGVLRDTTSVAYSGRGPGSLAYEAERWVSPLVAFLGSPVLDFAGRAGGWGLDPSYESRTLVGGSSPRLSLVLLVALCSAALAFFLARRRLYRGKRLTAWIATAAAFGPVGILALWSTSDRPVCERCPACGRARLITRDHCERCAAPFPAPALDGTEILLPATM